MKISRKYAHLAFAFFMSMLMGFIMSGVLTALLIGLNGEFFSHWMHAFATAWVIAFPAITVVAPIARKLAALVTEPENS